MNVRHNPPVEQLPTTHPRPGAVRINDHNGPEAKWNEVVNGKVMPKLLISWWNLKEDSSASVLLSITDHLNSNPMSFPKGHEPLNFLTAGLDTRSNQ